MPEFYGDHDRAGLGRSGMQGAMMVEHITVHMAASASVNARRPRQRVSRPMRVRWPCSVAIPLVDPADAHAIATIEFGKQTRSIETTPVGLVRTNVEAGCNVEIASRDFMIRALEMANPTSGTSLEDVTVDPGEERILRTVEENVTRAARSMVFVGDRVRLRGATVSLDLSSESVAVVPDDRDAPHPLLVRVPPETGEPFDSRVRIEYADGAARQTIVDGCATSVLERYAADCRTWMLCVGERNARRSSDPLSLRWDGARRTPDHFDLGEADLVRQMILGEREPAGPLGPTIERVRALVPPFSADPLLAVDMGSPG